MPETSETPPATPPRKSSPRWLTLAVASGAFAAFNGVFAKLTTTSQTATIARTLSHLIGLSTTSNFIEYIFRAIFFGLNIASNAIMWILFTRALTAASSTTRVAILNTSSNFMVTAILGMIVFSESLPLGWWVGAAFLVAGSVVIGAREENIKGEGGGVTKGADGPGGGVALGLDEAVVAGEATAAGVGAGGVGQSVLAKGIIVDGVDGEEENERYQDDAEDLIDDPPPPPPVTATGKTALDGEDENPW